MGLSPGVTLGRYQIIAALGRGGIATVYRYQPGIDRTVALKVIFPPFANDPGVVVAAPTPQTLPNSSTDE